jgi:hypothetical protein
MGRLVTGSTVTVRQVRRPGLADPADAADRLGGAAKVRAGDGGDLQAAELDPAAVAAARAQHAGQGVPPSPPVTQSAILASPSRPARTSTRGKQAGMAEGGSSGGEGTLRRQPRWPPGHEAMRTAWSRHPAAVARLSCQTTLIGHNDTCRSPG